MWLLRLTVRKISKTLHSSPAHFSFIGALIHRSRGFVNSRRLFPNAKENARKCRVHLIFFFKSRSARFSSWGDRCNRKLSDGVCLRHSSKNRTPTTVPLHALDGNIVGLVRGMPDIRSKSEEVPPATFRKAKPPSETAERNRLDESRSELLDGMKIPEGLTNDRLPSTHFHSDDKDFCCS